LALADAGSDLVSILLDKSDGTFQAASGVAVGPYPLGVATGDFNGDGNLDLVTANDDAFSLSVSLGDGRGGFSSHVDYMAGLFPDSVVAVDLNLDGKLDLVSANTGADTISVLLGNGDGTFQPATTYTLPAADDPIVVVAGDFNHDGKPDIAALNTYSNTVSILLGNGDGTLQTNVDYPAGSYPFGLVVGDFNGDGALDLAVTNSDCDVPASNCPGTVSLLFGNGDGTFQPPVGGYLVGLYPSYLAAANLNGDGGADLAVPNASSGTVSILLNLPVIGIFPNALNFGTEKVGVKSSALNVTIGNPSGTPISISKPKMTGANAADFAETTTCPLAPSTLVAGASCSISVTFTPKSTGARSAMLSLKDSAPGSPQLIQLGGTGQ
jgi:hypothetical protein